MHLTQLPPRTTSISRSHALTSTEHTFVTWDGSTLFYRAWLPDHPAARAVILFHRGHEHSARWQETVESLDLPDTAFFAWDQRGHGHSPGERGHAPSLSAITKDADRFARHLVREHGIDLEQTAVIASSVGGVIAAAWLHLWHPHRLQYSVTRTAQY